MRLPLKPALSLLGPLHRQIGTKLAIFTTLVVVLAVVALGANFDMFLRQSFLDATHARMQHAYQRLDYNLSQIESQLQEGSAFAAQDEPLVASIELINRYQDKAHYNTALIDEEKKALAANMLARVKLSLNSDMVLYDQSNELIAFASRQGAGHHLGYLTFVDGQPQVLVRAESEREFRPGALPGPGNVAGSHLAKGPGETTGQSGLTTYQRLGNTLVIKAHQNVFEPLSNRHVAHMELSYVLNGAYFEQLSKDMDIQISQAFDSPLAAQSRQLGSRADIESLVISQSPDQYVGVMHKSTLGEPVYFLVALDKTRENALVNRQRLQMLAILLTVALTMLLFMRLVFKRSLVQPLDRLMAQIRQIKQGNYTVLPTPATGDELEEISQSINTLGQAVALRESALEKARHEAEFLAKHDALTGLPNQRFLADRMAHAIALAQRNKSQLAVLFLDLDQFKLVNDTLGHPMGDVLLASIAKRFGRTMRSTDTLARVGGDEFNILIENVHAIAELELVVDKYLTLFQTPFVCGEHSLSITASIGVAVYPKDGLDSVELLKHADLAVYAAKERGRNTSCFYDAGLSRLAAERAGMIHDLKAALDAGNQFELYYQPKVSADTGGVVSAEALIRWHKPGAGLVPPVKFIALAEETRQIIPLGDWIIAQACRDLAHMVTAGVMLQHVSINVSNVQLQGHDLLAVLNQALAQHGLLARQLELEITESYIAQDTQAAIASLHAFRKLGLALAIDDFGTGYSSLSYLRKLPFTRLKIDKSFVDGLPTDPDSAAIALAIIGLAKTFGLSVTAEGVERADQLAFLRQAGCDEVQGYYYAKPLPLADFLAFCQANQ